MAQILYELLTNAFKSVDNVKRKESEDVLIKNLVDNFHSFQFITNLAVSQDPMREQAISALNYAMIRMIKCKLLLTDKHLICLFQILQGQIPLKFKEHLKKSVVLLIKIDQCIYYNYQKTILEAKQEMISRTILLLQHIDYQKIQSGFIQLKFLLESIEINQFVSSINNDIDWINNILTIGAKILLENTTYQEEWFITLKCYLELLSDLFEKLFCDKQLKQEGSFPSQKILLNNESIINLLLYIIKYNINEGDQIQNSIIICSGNLLQDDALNEIKILSLKAYYYPINFYCQKKLKNQNFKVIFYQDIENIVQIFLYSLLSHMTQIQILDILKNKQVKGIINYIFKILGIFGCQIESFHLFSNLKYPLIYNAILPILVTTDYEIELMQENPEDFLYLCLDIIKNQECQTLQSSAAFLLNTLANYIDGTASFATQLSTVLCEFSIKSIDNKQIQSQNIIYNYIEQIKNQILFTQFNNIQRIDITLTALSILHMIIGDRPDLMQLIEYLLKEEFAFFLNSKDLIIQIKFSLLLSQYYEQLQKNQYFIDNCKQYLEILIHYIQSPQPIIVYQAVDTLFIIFESNKLKNQISCYISEVFTIISNLLQYSTLERHFTFIINILKSYTVLLNNENYNNLIQILVNRICYEEQQIQNGEKRYIHLNRCWNILRQLPDISGISLNLLEEAMKPLYNILVKGYEFSSSDELILFTISMIDKQQNISQLQIDILPYYSNIIQKQQGRLGNLYEMFNLYIQYGNDYFIDQNKLRILLDLIFESLKNPNLKGDLDLGEGTLLTQLIIQKFTLNKQIIQTILNESLQLLQQEDEEPALKSRIGGILLTVLLINFQMFSEILGTYAENIFHQLQLINYYPGYDSKLFVISMCNVIKQLPNLITSELIIRIVDTLNKQKQYENDKYLYEQEFSDEEKQFEYDNNDELGQEQDEENIIFDQQILQFKSAIIKFDEYTIFKNTIKEIKEKNPEKIELLKQTLTPNYLNQLNDLMHYFRLNDNQNLQPRKYQQASQRKKKN